MKQVSTSKYDTEYYNILYPYSYNKKVTVSDFGAIPLTMGGMLKLNKRDTVVDFGCGSGDLIFHLYARYKCNAIGIDYSKDAIDICEVNKRIFYKKNKIPNSSISFLHKNLKHLPQLENIKAVYMQDVIEHMYDPEIDEFLQSIKTWNENKLYLVIHTDNNIFLTYLRPFLDAISLVTKKMSSTQIKERNQWEDERHVNLTTVRKLKRKLKAHGFKTEKVRYPTVDIKRLRSQLGKIGEITPLLYLLYIPSKLLSPLRPSFFLLAKHEKYN